MQTVIFDFGNVIGFFDHQRTLQRLEPYTDLPAEQMFRHVYAGALEDAFESNHIGEDEFLDRFIAECRLTCSREYLAAACADIFSPNPEICALIPQLRPRYQILLGSNTNVIHARMFKRQFADVFRHFDALVLSHEIGVRKPKADFFQHCQKLAKGSAAECVFIDDLAPNVRGAQMLGWKGIVYHPNNGLLKSLQTVGIRL